MLDISLLQITLQHPPKPAIFCKSFLYLAGCRPALRSHIPILLLIILFLILSLIEDFKFIDLLIII